MTSVKLLQAVRTDTRLHTIWLMASNSPDLNPAELFFLECHARESVPDTHSEYQLVWPELEKRHITLAIR